MAHTYIVTSVSTGNNIAIVQGTVDGIVVQVPFPATMVFASVVSFQNYIQPLMLAAAFSA